jgi:acetoin utilization deacetylase AcuC-like enzyme
MKSMSSKEPMPFTPQVRKHMKPESSDNPAVKNVNTCDTSFSVGSLDAARRAAGAVMTAVDRVLRGRNRNAFCVVRPPGHHAGRKGLLADASSHGFCIFNSVAAGALHALESPEHRLSRVAIVDIDVHHGNGTEEIVRTFQSPERLLFFSIHLYDKDKDAPGGYEFYPG